jgi:hypothetical protein
MTDLDTVRILLLIVIAIAALSGCTGSHRPLAGGVIQPSCVLACFSVQHVSESVLNKPAATSEDTP